MPALRPLPPRPAQALTLTLGDLRPRETRAPTRTHAHARPHPGPTRPCAPRPAPHPPAPPPRAPLCPPRSGAPPPGQRAGRRAERRLFAQLSAVCVPSGGRRAAGGRLSQLGAPAAGTPPRRAGRPPLISTGGSGGAPAPRAPPALQIRRSDGADVGGGGGHPGATGPFPAPPSAASPAHRPSPASSRCPTHTPRPAPPHPRPTPWSSTLSGTHVSFGVLIYFFLFFKYMYFIDFSQIFHREGEG